MSGTVPTSRRITGALDALLALPPAALAVLAECVIDRLDALDASGVDVEPDDDGEADQDGEAAFWEDWHTWPPTIGPGCCTVRLG